VKQIDKLLLIIDEVFCYLLKNLKECSAIRRDTIKLSQNRDKSVKKFKTKNIITAKT